MQAVRLTSTFYQVQHFLNLAGHQRLTCAAGF
jgi:hypothetical protein